MSRLCLTAAFDRRLLRRSLRRPCFLRSALSRQRVVRTSLRVFAFVGVALEWAQTGEADALGASASAPATMPAGPIRRMSVRVLGTAICPCHRLSRQPAALFPPPEARARRM